MKVKVSWKDINNGTPNDANKCAVACAKREWYITRT